MLYKIKDLEQKIKTARSDYHNGTSTISDKAYDALVDELEKLDPKNPQIIGVGAEPTSSWKKYAHPVPLGSLNKCNTPEEYESWHNKYVTSTDEVVLTPKLDGLSLSIHYETGKLVRGVTRGSGVNGENITSNVVKMQGIPLRLTQKINCVIRGEILVAKNTFSKYFSDTYNNSRNFASGASRKFSGENCDKLTVLSYELRTNDLEFTTKREELELLRSLGFTVPDYKVLKTAKEVISLKNQYQNSLRDKSDWDLDGLVITLNNIEKFQSFDYSDNRPKAAIAYKFDNVSKIGTVSRIDNQVGSAGRITPVCTLDPPINLGTMVSRATLHNFSNVNDLGIDVGAKVLICRAGDVIPFVEEVVESTGTVFQAPKKCPECDTDTVENGEYIECPNSKSCPAQVQGKIDNWITGLNIMNWGPSVIEKVIASGKVKTISDLYRLTKQDLFVLDRMGTKSAEKCYANLWAFKEIPLDILIGSLSIPMIGTSTIKLAMAAGYNTLEKLQAAKASNFEKIAGIGPVKAQSLEIGLLDNQEIIEKLLDRGITVKQEVKSNGKLSGVSFCFTGKAENKRAVLEKMVTDNGGEVKSVTKGLSYLVTNDEDLTTSKAVKALALGTKIITEAEFIAMTK